MNRSILLCLFLVLFSCKTIERPENKSIDQHRYRIEENSYARGFEISYSSDYKIIRVFDINNSFDTIQTLRIGQKPDLKEVDLSDNLNRIACNSTTHASFFAKLGLAKRIKALSWPELIMNKEIRSLIDDGSITNLGSQGEINLEYALELDLDLLMVYPFESLNYDRYLNAGLPLVYNTEYQELHPLAKAEWIKFYGALFGMEDKAKRIFEEIESEYLILKQSADSIEKKPTVFTGSYLNGQWFAPSSKSAAIQLLNDAGGQYVFEDLSQNGNVSLDFEVMYERCLNADFYGSVTSDILDLEHIEKQEERLSDLKSIRRGDVFYCNSSESDYFGDALLEPHEILADLISIFHPEIKREEFKYFKPIKMD